MIRHSIIIFALLLASLNAEQLKIVADSFKADEKKRTSIFIGNVKIKKGSDELNASKVTVYTDADQKPKKMVVEGDVSFYIKTETDDTYRGTSQKAVLLPIKKIYKFYTDVHLQQINQKKDITGDEVIIDTIKGKAFAKGAERKPVIMIFDIPDKNESK
ncbi:MAG: lipopolysaccharide transport periplasmic protein LptA [Campylobacterota bacterium]|nr:lipopolysaccharide transport periplasmic protein LptA [Campylobacterota bacterium]